MTEIDEKRQETTGKLQGGFSNSLSAGDVDRTK